MKTILMTISPIGKPTIEAQGFCDSSCAAASAPLIAALSRPGEAEIEAKAEMHIPASTSSGMQIGGY